MMRKHSPVAIRLAVFGLAVVGLLSACATALAPVPVVTTPKFPDFMFPAAPRALAAGDQAVRLQRGWQFLQGGDTKASRREFQAALRSNGRFYPAEAGLAYASLAERDFADAVNRFDRVLRTNAHYVPALVGRGDALVGAGKLDEARQAFAAALAEDASLVEVKRRLDVMGFRSQQAALQSARQAAEAGRLPEAAAAYGQAIASSPDSAFLYRELAEVERRQALYDQALAHLQTAVALDAGDARAWLLLGEVREAKSEFAEAVTAYSRAEAIEPGDEVTERLQRARARAALAKLPQEYRDIPNSAMLTRGELAALIGVRLAGVVGMAARRDSLVVTDTRNHWASPWIMAVIRAGMMEPFPNHTFMPRAVVRRIDMATVVQRILSVIAVRNQALAKQWQGAKPRISDVPAGHLGYPAVSAAIASGVMTLTDGAFRPSRVVSGADAIEMIGRLEVLAR